MKRGLPTSQSSWKILHPTGLKKTLIGFLNVLRQTACSRLARIGFRVQGLAFRVQGLGFTVASQCWAMILIAFGGLGREPIQRPVGSPALLSPKLP